MTEAGWRQLNLCCRDWQAAEAMAAVRLGPALTAAEDAGPLAHWWFARKGGRLAAAPPACRGTRQRTRCAAP
jgi:hypothetical protein